MNVQSARRIGHRSGNKKDRIGFIYGLLTVTARLPGKNYWLCECACGNEDVRVYGNRLTAGEKSHCGCQSHKPHKYWSTSHDHPLIIDYLTHYRYPHP